tara:strand:- start:294 stop:509 length:216 start_codon:yes stop_codon:yes gene_type:complete
MNLAKRTRRVRAGKDINPATLEQIFGEFDSKINTLDNRQIESLSELKAGASDAEVILKVNEIIRALNKTIS